MDWNSRYNTEEYLYGTEPNTFLAANASKLTGPVLSVAEGEGRNGVFLASLGLKVHGVDGSAVGLAKAQRLARAKGVEITTEVLDLADFVPAPGRYQSVVSIFAHLPSALRARLYPRLAHALPEGGVVLLEAYSEDQLAFGTGGPSDLDMLMTPEKIRSEFLNFEPLLLQQIERDVIEGNHHSGRSSVVQFIGVKRSR